jgi:hypothetical protein
MNNTSAELEVSLWQTVNCMTPLKSQRGQMLLEPAGDLLNFDFPYFPTCHAALPLAFHLWTQNFLYYLIVYH